MKDISIRQILNWLGLEKEMTDIPEGFIRHVVIDSRQVSEDTLFVALPGERVDGHDFISQAFEKGARIVLSQDPKKTKSILPHRNRK